MKRTTTKDREKFLIKLEKNYGNISKTCRQMGIKGGSFTVSKWRQEFPWFQAAVKEIKEMQFDKVEENVFKLAVDGPIADASALSARKFLLTHHPEGRQRGYRRKDELTGRLGVGSFAELVQEIDDDSDSKGG